MFSYIRNLPINIATIFNTPSPQSVEDAGDRTSTPLKVSFEPYWAACISLLKCQIKDLSHVPSSYEEVSQIMGQLHSRVTQVWLNTDHQRLFLDTSHVSSVQLAIFECSRFIRDNPDRCREAVSSMVAVLRFMREIYPVKTINQSLRRQINDLEWSEAPDAKHYINRIIPRYLPSKMPDSLKTLDARIYAIKWRGSISLLELRATHLRDHPTWYRTVTNEIRKLVNEVAKIKFRALTEAMGIGAPHEELICIADHCTLFILLVQAQLRTLSQDSKKAEWVASILIEYINSLDLNSGDAIPCWSDNEEFIYSE